MIGAAALSARRVGRLVASSYGVAPPLAVVRVHRGTNAVYRVECGGGGTRRVLAAKVSTLSPERSRRQKAAEKHVLDRLEGTFPHAPRCLAPGAPHEGGGRRAWGVVLPGGRALSVYEWVDCRPCDGSLASLAAAGRRFAQLHAALGAAPPLGPGDRAFSESRLLDFAPAGRRVSERFGFRGFEGAMRRDGAADAAVALARDHLGFLEREAQRAREELAGEDKLLASCPVTTVHAEPNPSNFGYGGDGEVRVIFDFDAVRRGVRAQDLAWMLATFCIDHRRPIAEANRRSGALLGGFEEVSPIADAERRLQPLLLRVFYLEAIWRGLWRRYRGPDGRMGFVAENVRTLRWLRERGGSLRFDGPRARREARVS